MTAIKFGDEASVDMVVDSGCRRDIIGEDNYRKCSAAPTLHATNIKLYPYCSTDPLNLVGKFKSRITCGKHTAVSTVKSACMKSHVEASVCSVCHERKRNWSTQRWYVQCTRSTTTPSARAGTQDRDAINIIDC